ncbi:hypothetical protein VPH35_090501 [Triticum aestivum]
MWLQLPLPLSGQDNISWLTSTYIPLAYPGLQLRKQSRSEWKPGHLFYAFGPLLLNGVTTRNVVYLTRFAFFYVMGGSMHSAICIGSSPSPSMPDPAFVCLIVHA